MYLKSLYAVLEFILREVSCSKTLFFSFKSLMSTKSSSPVAFLIIFFAYIGFDAISTTAEETENPQRDLPIAILGTLIICTILYVCVALVLTGNVPLGHIDIQAPIAHAMRAIGMNWFAGLISIGALCALTSVLLIYQLGTTRILYAMSRDRFLPKSLRLIHKKYRISDWRNRY